MVMPEPTLSFVDTAIRTFEGIQQLADVMAKCGTMPLHLQGKPQDCFRIVVQAAKWRMDPFVVAECTSLVHGRMCYEGKLVVAVLKAMNAIEGRLSYEFAGSGQDMSIVVTGTPRGGKPEQLSGSVKQWRTKTMKDGKEIPNNWDKDPQSQLVYRSSRQWTRLFAPEALLGVYTPDELEEVKTVEHEIQSPQAARVGNQEPVEKQAVLAPELKPEPKPKAPAHPALAAANAMWAQLEAKGKGKGKAVISRLCALYKIAAPKDLPAERLDAFGKDVAELTAVVNDEAAMEDTLGNWENAEKSNA